MELYLTLIFVFGLPIVVWLLTRPRPKRFPAHPQNAAK